MVLESICLNNQIPRKEFYLLLRNVLTGEKRGPELFYIVYLLNKNEVEERCRFI